MIKKKDNTLEDVLEAMEDYEAHMKSVYRERDLILATLIHIAYDYGYKAGLAIDHKEDWDDEWRNIIYIELPTGQCSWHIHASELEYFRDIPDYKKEWDNHTTEEKYDRIKKFCRNQYHIG